MDEILLAYKTTKKSLMGKTTFLLIYKTKTIIVAKTGFPNYRV